MAHTREYLEAVHAAASRLLPPWMMRALHQAALPSSGGNARHRPGEPSVADGTSAAGTPGEPVDLPSGDVIPATQMAGEPEEPVGQLDVAPAVIEPTTKDGPTSGQVHVDRTGGVIDPRFLPGMATAGGEPKRRPGGDGQMDPTDPPTVQKGGGRVEIVVKRAYDVPGRDGIRVLVDREWPRAVTKSFGRFAMHLPRVAPSEGLAAWQQANPGDWAGFERRYLAELGREPARTAVAKLAALARRTPVTLVTAAPDREHNAATVLRDLMAGTLDEPDDGTAGRRARELQPGAIAFQKAKWTKAYIDTLPDASFAYIAPGGRKDADGKTVPRDLRHLPYRDHDGDDDEDHIRDALSRLPQTDIPDAAKAEARRKIEAAAHRVGVDVAKAEWSTAYKDSLPDSSFAWVQPGGKKDETGRTVPRDLRHLPYRDEHGKVDDDHLRSALSKIGSVAAMPGTVREHVRRHLEATLASLRVGKSSWYASIVKADAQRQVAYAVVLEPDTFDSQGDRMTPEEIEKSAHRYLEQARNVGLQHAGTTRGAAPVESYIAPQDLEYTGPDGTKHPVRKGSWVMAVHVAEPGLWRDVQEGRYSGYSVGGWGERKPA